MTKTILFCIFAPVFGALAVGVVLVAGAYIGQGLWDALFCLGGF